MRKNIFTLFVMLFPLAMDAPVSLFQFFYPERRETETKRLYEAFHSGNYECIVHFFEENQQNACTFPLASSSEKAIEEELLEEVARKLLNNLDSFYFFKNHGQFYAISDEKIYHFSHIVKKVNWNHIRFEPEQCNAYHFLLTSKQLLQAPHIDGLDRLPVEEDFGSIDEPLTLPEKEAINIYTGKLYRAMNAFMRGDIEKAISFFSHENEISNDKINHWIKEIFLHSVMAVSALHRLSDHQNETHPYLYRVEKEVPISDLHKRQLAVSYGGGITSEMGFLSTAYDKPAESYFNEQTEVAILIENRKGKNITFFSRCGSLEREILLPPTQMQWLGQVKIADSTGKHTLYLFLARPVTVDQELTIDNFSPLPEWKVFPLQNIPK